jgi:hypothetical protein
MNYKLSYNFEPHLNCGIIRFNDKQVLMDFSDLFSIINFEKNFIYYDPEEKTYPYYLRHNQKISYLEHIFKYDSSNIEYVFKNNNSFDLRRENIIIYHNYHKQIFEKNEILEHTLGHYIEIGKDAYVIKNPMWKIKENLKEYWLMYCETNTIIKLCSESYQKIIDYESQNNDDKKITWFKLQNGYIMGSNNLYIHQIITGCYGNGKGTKNISVDHIDQNPLNNTMANLRIATREEQEQNTKGIKEGTKRERKYNAKDLPEEITQAMMRKYVVYYKDYADKEKKRLREYFKIEKHPKLAKIWIGCKSSSISIQEKLAQANKIVDDLENDIYPEKSDHNLPKYVSLVISRDKPHLVFEKIHLDKKLNLKMVLPEEYDINEQIMLLKIKVREKYGECLIGNDVIFNYIYDTVIDNINKYVKTVTFNISRYGNIKQTLNFEIEKTEREAITEAEKWLSEKITEDHFYKTNENENLSFNEYKNGNKGIILSSAIFIEIIEKIQPNHIYLDCSS